MSFEEASDVLFSPLTLSNVNTHPDGNRFEYLGPTLVGDVLFVVTVEETEDEIRIISARKATTRERREYEEGKGI